MYSPTVSNRVRVSGREDDFIVVRVDHAASVADLCPMVGDTAFEEDVPFHLLEFDDTPSFIHEDRLAAGRAVLDSSHLVLCRSHAAVADLMDLIAGTMDAIRTSRSLIARSDHIIGRIGFEKQLND